MLLGFDATIANATGVTISGSVDDGGGAIPVVSVAQEDSAFLRVTFDGDVPPNGFFQIDALDNCTFTNGGVLATPLSVEYA